MVRTPASDPHVKVSRVLRPVAQQLGREIAHVQADHGPLPHRNEAPGGGVQEAVVEQADLTGGEEATAEVGVLSVKFNRRVEAVDALERFAADGEIAAIEHRADPRQLLDQALWG